LFHIIDTTVVVIVIPTGVFGIAVVTVITYAIAIWSNIALLLLATGTVFTIKDHRLPTVGVAAAD